MYVQKTFYGPLTTKMSPQSTPASKQVYCGNFQKRGVNGTRTYNSKGYVYIVPTDYNLSVMQYPYVRKWQTQWDAGKEVTYLAIDGYSNLNPDSNSCTVVYNDTYYGMSPQYAAKQKAYNALVSNMCNYAMLTKDLRDGLKLSQDYFDRLLKAAPYIRRKNFRKAFKAFFGTSSKKKAVANTWLEFQWGVKPTIDAVQTALQRVVTDDARTIRITSAGKSERATIPNTKNPNYFWENGIWETARCKCYRYFRNNYFVEQAAFNPVEPAFDAVPWSFLVNWFIPIEDYLRQFGYVSNWSGTFGCDSLKIEELFDVRQIRAGRAGVTSQRYKIDFLTPRRNIRFARSTASTINLPLSFAEMLDRGSINLSIKRLLNTTALVVQRL